MPDIIQLLPDTVANQIAAGEVVQRPASVVKELLENAVDAGANNIQLIIKDAGRTLIQVVDNGSGMSITDARMSFERHATSKIKSTEDIFKIHTKGFRGEALASIAAVAQVELKTKKEEDEIGTQILIDGGDFISQNPINTQSGSSLSVKNLFFNVPARRKFLKSNAIEFKHILDELYRIAITHPDINFQLFHNDDEILRLRKAPKIQRIADIFGKKFQEKSVSVHESMEWVSLTGYVGKPEASKKSRGEQFLFVNNRFFKSPYLNKAVQDAFENIIPSDYFPSYFLNIDINPEMIDVNIHPTKTEVKFENESIIYALIRSAIKKSLGVYHILPSLDFTQNPEWLSSPSYKPNDYQPKITVDRNFNPFSDSQQRPSQNDKINLSEFYQLQQEIVPENTLFSPPIINAIRLSNGNWLVENKGELKVVNVYRMHQTILYDTYIKATKGNPLSQQLLFPLEKIMTTIEKEKINSIQKNLINIGFDIDIKDDILLINAIPMDIHQDKILDLMEYLLEKLEDHEAEEFEIFFSKSAAYLSALKKDMVLHLSQFQTLYDDFLKISTPLYNPFGKVNYVSIYLADYLKQLE